MSGPDPNSSGRAGQSPEGRRPLRPDAEHLVAAVGDWARPLRSSDDLDPLLQSIGDARCVLLGEATHGTSEFYTWRTRLTQRLVREKGFSFVGVEGDWPDCYRVNRFVKGAADLSTSAEDVLRTFVRWPTWMWANREVAELVTWLRRHNARRAAD
jgi:erythromycin esterase